MTARETLIARQDMARQHAAERPTRILRALADHPDGLSTPQLIPIMGEPVIRQRALTWYGQILRKQTEAGRVERLGLTPGAWQDAPAVIWGITAAGRERLRELDDSVRAAGDALTAHAAALARAAERERRLDAAAGLYGRGTPRPGRQRVARELTGLGCTLEQVGEVFGVTREMIRKDLAWDGVVRRPGRPKLPPRATLRQRIRAGVAEEIARAIEKAAGELAGLCAAVPCPDCTRRQQAADDAALARSFAGDDG